MDLCPESKKTLANVNGIEEISGAHWGEDRKMEEVGMVTSHKKVEGLLWDE